MAYEVHLDVFEGPLDLLLFLIKKEDLDIYNIPISRITQEYLSYLELMKDLNLDVAGEFLVLAATLMAIKSRTLLPSPEAEEEEGPDPRAELTQKLVEYQKFKEAAAFLGDRLGEFEGVHYRQAPRFDDSEKTLGIDAFELLEALRRAIKRAPLPAREAPGEEFHIEERIDRVLSLLDGKSCVTLDEVFAPETRRQGFLTAFLAVLELVKLQRIFLRQEAPLAPILIFKKEASVHAAA